jgi:hypothetical protein
MRWIAVRNGAAYNLDQMIKVVVTAAKNVELTPITGPKVDIAWTDLTREAQHMLEDIVGKATPKNPI